MFFFFFPTIQGDVDASPWKGGAEERGGEDVQQQRQWQQQQSPALYSSLTIFTCSSTNGGVKKEKPEPRMHRGK